MKTYNQILHDFIFYKLYFFLKIINKYFIYYIFNMLIFFEIDLK